jgi:hypothetical protein
VRNDEWLQNPTITQQKQQQQQRQWLEAEATIYWLLNRNDSRDAWKCRWKRSILIDFELARCERSGLLWFKENKSMWVSKTDPKMARRNSKQRSVFIFLEGNFSASSCMLVCCLKRRRNKEKERRIIEPGTASENADENLIWDIRDESLQTFTTSSIKGTTARHVSPLVECGLWRKHKVAT